MQVRDVSEFTGFWRRFRVTPEVAAVTAELEDDFHCMRVIVEHDGIRAQRVVADMRRVPWSTCPGATAQLSATFGGCELAGFARRGDKVSNCTHLHDLAVLGAAHAFDEAMTEFDILIDDPVDGIRRAEIWRNGVRSLCWSESRMILCEPADIAGVNLFRLNDWISTLDPEAAELARLLRWGNVIANGRQIPLEQQSDATRMPPNCFSFQSERAAVAQRVGRIRDFSGGKAVPLEAGLSRFATDFCSIGVS